VGEPREFLQAGLELIGVPGADGEAEVVAIAVEALTTAGLRRHRIGVGDGALYRSLLASFGVPAERHLPLLETLSRRDLVGLEGQVRELELGDAERDLLVRLPLLRGGREVLERAAEAGGAEQASAGRDAVVTALDGLRALHERLDAKGVSDRVIFDLGLVRELGYYTGAVFEVYDAAFGAPMGGGGRYDDLLGRFGRELPACGWALDIERVHAAQAAEESVGAEEQQA
jgi:ATP phosphoribosyltransferase regulatory subunit HisZ